MRRRVLLGSLAAGVSFFAGCSSDGQSQQSSDDPAEDSTQEPTETDAEVTETDTETATATPEPGYTVEWTESMNTAGIRLALDHGVAVWSLNGFSIRTAGSGATR